VIAPPYDVLTSDEARQRAKGRPWSFLHISKPEIDLDVSVHVYSEAVYAKAAENLKTMIESGILARDPKPNYYIYRISLGPHSQTGLVAAASLEAYREGRIRRHEFTTPAKENDRIRQIDALNAQTGPVMMAYPRSPKIDALLAKAATGEPAVDIIADDGVHHALWVVDDDRLIGELTSRFEELAALYIADGHHRSAAADKVAEQAGTGDRDGGDGADGFLTVIFPAAQMNILDYNRVITDLNGRDPGALIAEIENSFTVEPADRAMRPKQRGEFGMYLAGSWYRLRIKPELAPDDDPLAGLDISLLSKYLIEPLLGISDPRRDKRIDFVGGSRGLEALEARVNSGEMAVAFALFPTAMEDVLAVADAGEVMPPKSTWFEPKLADGLVSLVLD
jgi:uncharacterized protein (DUF1015 family)